MLCVSSDFPDEITFMCAGNLFDFQPHTWLCVAGWFCEPSWAAALGAAALGALQRPAIKPPDRNRMLFRLHIVIMSQQIPVCTLLQRKDVCWFVWGFVCFFGVQLMCTLFDEWGGGLISCMLYHINIAFEAADVCVWCWCNICTDVCVWVCTSSLSFPCSSHQVSLVSIGCERKSHVCKASTTGTDLCVCECEAFTMPQWINHTVWAVTVRLWRIRRENSVSQWEAKRKWKGG